MARDNKNIGKRNNTMTQKLLQTVGEEKIKKLWVEYGMYKSAELLSDELQEYVSSSTIRYLSQIKNWKRLVNKRSAIFKGVKAGTVKASYYKQLIFPKEEEENVKI